MRHTNRLELAQCAEDKFGLSWQIVSVAMIEILTNADSAGQSAMAAMLKMKKLGIAELERAFAG